MRNRIDGSSWTRSLIGAIRAFRLKDLKLAEERLDKAFSIAGKDVPQLHLLAGHIAFAQNSLKSAERSWKTVLKLEPENAEAWNNLGVLYRRRGDEEKALAAFQEAEEKAPDRPDIPYNIGNLQKAAGRIDEAISAYNRAIEINPGYTPAYNNLGTLYEVRNERTKALAVIRRGLSADPGDASLRYNLGLVYQEESQWDDARQAFDEALKSRPGWVPGLNNLGIVLQEMGREEEAARTFRSLLNIEPGNVNAMNNLGVAYSRLGRSEDARQCFRNALKTEPDYITAALNLHDSYHDSQQLSEALEEINKQITHHPTDPEVRVRMARTLMKMTRWEEAERSINHVLERIPDHSGALRIKAELYLATNRADAAEQILRSLPHDPAAVRDLARLHIASGRPERAIRLLEELIAIDPDDSESRRLLAELLSETDPANALRHREELVAAASGDTGDMVSLAELYGRTGNRDKALAVLDQAVNELGNRGDAGDLNEMNDILALYDRTTAALEEERGPLFSERTAQLGRKLQSVLGSRGRGSGMSGRIISEEIPVDEEDALSLLDINAMEPVIRINEDEETVYLDESAEELEDEYTELYRPDYPPRDTGQPSAQAGGRGGGGTEPSGGPAGSGTQPPIHIHLPPQMPGPAVPQVIYQDVRPVVYPSPPPRPAPPPEMPVSPVENLPEVSVEDFDTSEIPGLPEVADDANGDPDADAAGADGLEITIEEEELEESVPALDEPEDGNHFYIPDSDALSEDLPETGPPPEPPAADLNFDLETSPPEIEPLLMEEEEDVLVLDDGFDEEPALEIDFDGEDAGLLETVPDDEDLRTDGSGSAVHEPAETEPAGIGFNATGSGSEHDSAPPVSDKMAQMFKYLSDLTDETRGEGRQKLIEDGIPLKLAGIHARLIGEPRLREVAQKFDRRRRDRHNVELDEEKIKGSLNAFKSLAEAYPNQSVGESLSQKLARIMSFVAGKPRDDS